MPVQIGAPTHNFTDPTGLLSDCHRRVEMFLGTLEAVANVIDRPATEESRRALESALRYFAQAAPKHTADEEESLFPRLRQIQDPEVEAVFSKLEQLEDEHRWAAPLHAEVDRLGAHYLSYRAVYPVLTSTTFAKPSPVSHQCTNSTSVSRTAWCFL